MEYLSDKFVEFFGRDEDIDLYLELRENYSQEKAIRFYEGYYASVEMGWRGVISLKDLQEFLDNLRKFLPKKFPKKWKEGVMGFDNTIVIVWNIMQPLTFEASKKKKK